MFVLDIYGNPEPRNIYLAKADGTLIAQINHFIDEDTAELQIGVNSQYQLTFTLKDSGDNPWTQYMVEGNYLFVDSVGLFKMSSPSISIDGLTEEKSINLNLLQIPNFQMTVRILKQLA